MLFRSNPADSELVNKFCQDFYKPSQFLPKMMKLSVAMLMLLTSHILHTVNTISLTFTRSYTALGRNQLFESDKLACTGLVTVAPNNAATVGGWFKGSSCDYLKMPDLLDTATASQTGNYFKFIRVTKTTSGTTALRIWPCNQWVLIDKL